MSLYMHQLSDNESESHQSEPEEVEEDNYSVNDNDNDEHALEVIDDVDNDDNGEHDEVFPVTGMTEPQRMGNSMRNSLLPTFNYELVRYLIAYMAERDYFENACNRLKCPVCSQTHKELKEKASNRFRQGIQHQCSHGAIMIFASCDCPVCMEDNIEPPMVALSCGHVICRQDFKRLGGRIGKDAVKPRQPPHTISFPSNLSSQIESQIDGVQQLRDLISQFDAAEVVPDDDYSRDDEADDSIPSPNRLFASLGLHPSFDEEHLIIADNTRLEDTISDYEDGWDESDNESFSTPPPLLSRRRHDGDSSDSSIRSEWNM